MSIDGLALITGSPVAGVVTNDSQVIYYSRPELRSADLEMGLRRQGIELICLRYRQSEIRMWSALVDYSEGERVLGSDGRSYEARVPNGPGLSVVEDPITRLNSGIWLETDAWTVVHDIDNGFLVEGLLPDTVYEYQLQLVGDQALSPWSNSENSRTASTP